MRITQKQENLKKERERIKLLKQIEENQKNFKRKRSHITKTIRKQRTNKSN